MRTLAWTSALILMAGLADLAAAPGRFTPERKLNNLVSELLDVSPVSGAKQPFTFARAADGWILLTASWKGNGTARLILDGKPLPGAVRGREGEGSSGNEAMRFVTRGEHSVALASEGAIRLEKLAVKAIPELIHCGLGFNPAIKAYGSYDWDFLAADVLPNVTTLIVPNNLKLPMSRIEDWHRQGKRFVGEVGLNSQAMTAEDHFRYWTSFFDQASFLDGIIINEFIVNRPVAEWAALTPERLARMEQERQQYAACGEAIQRIRADERYKDKMLYAYIGGSGKKLNQEIIGTHFLRTIVDCSYRVALERYLHEMSSPKGAQEALQTFVDGIADWEAKEPGIKKRMVIAFGLLSMPPGSINKQPNVDFHVWMDQQMNRVANDPSLSEVAGLEWWTSSLADEETVRFVGKLYHHYAIEGKTNLLTRDPLFLTHIQNADFEKGTDGWILQPSQQAAMAVKSYPRYGRIEGRYMGLGRPADPEHIGDTFLWMKRSEKGPSTFSQVIQDLEPGRLYSMEMLTCDYQDLASPQARKQEEAAGFIGSVAIEGAEVDPKRSFTEMYASSPEPKIPVWITYHRKVFRAKSTTAKLTVSDWPSVARPGLGFGQEQAFNFLEIQPYWE